MALVPRGDVQVSMHPEQIALNNQYSKRADAESLLPIKITPFYRAKVAQELQVLGAPVGPLHRVVYPSAERLTVRAPGEVADFVSDRTNMPPGLQGVLIQKYRDRVLFLPTTQCLAHCQYCFRQDLLSEAHRSEEGALLERKVQAAKQYIAERPEIEEVILSGGDPLALPCHRLERVLDDLLSLPRPLALRIHTKALAFAPHLVSARMIVLLNRHKVRLVAHFVHPYEICDVVAEKLTLLLKGGVRVYNQFPILRQVNDHVEVLRRLLGDLDRLGVRTMSMFIPDPINYSACFRINWRRLSGMLDRLNWSSPAWVNAVRVVLDSPIGKVRREDLVKYDEPAGRVVFARDGHEVCYPDLPAALDCPGTLSTMLWNEGPSMTTGPL